MISWEPLVLYCIATFTCTPGKHTGGTGVSLQLKTQPIATPVLIKGHRGLIASLNKA